MIVYNGSKREVTLGDEVIPFFCGEVLTEEAAVLLHFKSGGYTLQDAYTMIMIMKLQRDAMLASRAVKPKYISKHPGGPY